MRVTGQNNINAGYICCQFLVNVKAVMRQQHNNFCPVCARLVNIVLNFIRAYAKRPAFNQMAGVGDRRIGEMLANHRNLNPASLKIGDAVKDTFFPFCIKTVTAQKRVAHFINQFF